MVPGGLRNMGQFTAIEKSLLPFTNVGDWHQRGEKVIPAADDVYKVLCR